MKYENEYLAILNEELKKAMEETRKIYHDPYYWAGFILLD